MRTQRKDRRGDLIPVILAAIVAVVGQTVILFLTVGPHPHRCRRPSWPRKVPDSGS